MAEPGPAHLSIGEVLGLLLEEFPDVTISKIRFLESQGLIEPERTPSGYRKFFDDDVELLRVILREQRENFLPLRVIKDRIDSGEIERGRPDAAAGGADGDAASPSDASRRRPSGRQPPRRRRRPADRCAAPSRRVHAAPRATRRRRPTPAPRLLPGVLVNRDELCAMASVTPAQLAQLEDYGVVADGARRRRPVRRGRRRDRRGRRRVPAGRRRCPPPAGLADLGRARGRAVRAADPAGAAPAQPAGPGRRRPTQLDELDTLGAQAAGGADAGRRCASTSRPDARPAAARRVRRRVRIGRRGPVGARRGPGRGARPTRRWCCCASRRVATGCCRSTSARRRRRRSTTPSRA